MEPFTAPRGRHFLLGVLALLLLLTLQAGATGDVGNLTRDDAHIESVVVAEHEHEQQQPPWLGRWFGKWGIAPGKECEEQYGIMPCSVSLGGNAALLVIYGFMLLKAAQLLSDGSELLLTVMSPGVIGGLVLPILGAFPDALLITVSGLGASQAEAQQEVLVGMGLVAGSSVMVLTALWGACLILGRCDLVESPPDSGKLVAKDRKLSPENKFSLTSLTKSGVTNDKQTQWASWIMVATLLPYLVAQTPRLLGMNTEGRAFILVAAIIAVLGLCCYCAYQIASPWYQQKKIDMAKHKYNKRAIRKVSDWTKEKQFGDLFKQNGEASEEVLTQVFRHFDNEDDGYLAGDELSYLLFEIGIQKQGKIPNRSERKHWMLEFDKSDRDGKISLKEFLDGFQRWVKTYNASNKKSRTGSRPIESQISDQENQMESAELLPNEDDNDDDDDEDEEKNKPEPSPNDIIKKAVCYLIAGAAVAAVFADPLVDAIGGFSKASGISPFFISFIATPLATNSSEAISSLIFAKKKRKRTISMTYSQIYGAVTMNNTMCLGIFLAIVYFRNLLWDFSAEVSVIFFATVIMACVAAFRTTFPLWMAIIGLALYPLSIAFVAFLDYVCGWH